MTRDYQYIFTGSKLPEVDRLGAADPVTFVACVNDEDQLSSNLLRSPCLQADSQHELLTYRGASSAADSIEILWPSGRVDALKNVRGGRVVTIREGAADKVL